MGRYKGANYRFPAYLLMLMHLLGFGLLYIGNQNNRNILYVGAGLLLLFILIYTVIILAKMGDKFIVLMACMLITIGVLLLCRIKIDYGIRQIMWVALGGVGFFAAYVIYYNIRFWNRLWLFYLLAGIGLFLATLLFGTNINGSKNWIVIHGFSFQPSEITKILFIFFLSCYYAKSWTKPFLRLSPKWITWCGTYLFIGFLVLQRDWGSILVFFFIYIFMIYVYEEKFGFLAFNVGLASAVALLGYKFLYHIQVRVSTWLNPWNDISNKGYQITQSLFAIASGGYFGRGLGNLSAGLVFDNGLQFTTGQMLVNLAVVLAVFAVFTFAASKWRQRIPGILTVGIIAVVCMSVVNTVGICRSINEIKAGAQSDGGTPTFSLSKTGKNVVVLMLDRAMGPYIPYIFNEKPELEAQFDGFTYYSNTASLGIKTNISTPSLFGGYEYTPAELNARDQELLVDKQNEALKVLPVMFDQNGFDVTVLEPVYAGYGWVPDLSIFQDYPDIRRFNVRGYFSDPKLQAQAIRSNKRNFFCYALMKAAPLCIQANLYDYGTYNQGNFVSDDGYAGQSTDGALTASGISAGFMNSYNVLANLPNITQISKDDTNTYMVLTNDTTHDPVLLQEPEYVPAPEVDNTQYEREHADRFTVNGRTMTVQQRNDYAYYQCNVAALLQLGKWFDYLRENGVYDNTRIIVMSDHGGTMGQFPEMLADDGMDAESFASLLMVKDFNSKGFTTSDEFMLSADVPLLAVKDVVADPVNPFSGRRIDEVSKPKQEQLLLYSFEWDVNVNCGTQFIAGDWYTVNGDIWNKNAWHSVANKAVLTAER